MQSHLSGHLQGARCCQSDHPEPDRSARSREARHCVIAPAIRSNRAAIIPLMCNSSRLRVTAVLSWFFEPLGRPRRRFLLAGGVTWTGLALPGGGEGRTTCSIRTGNECRCSMLTKDKLKNASPGTGRLYKLEKNRPRPWVCLPALVTTTSSPTKR